MQNSIFIARLLGPAFLVLGVAIFVEPRSFRAILGDFIESRATTYMAGVMGLLAGTAIVLTHNIWSWDWRLVITLIGWIMILRALVTIFLPGRIAAIGMWMLRHRDGFTATALMSVALGTALSWFGYSA